MSRKIMVEITGDSESLAKAFGRPNRRRQGGSDMSYEEWQVHTLAAFLKLNAQLAHEIDYDKLQEQDWRGLASKALLELRVLKQVSIGVLESAA